MDYRITAVSKDGKCGICGETVRFVAERSCNEAFFQMEITFPGWEQDCYVMMPGCAYNGNRFTRVKRNYPPMYRKEELGENREPLITDIPAFNPDGTGCIQVTAGDMAVPCVGIFNRQKCQGFLLFTQQHIKGRNLGFTLTPGSLTVSYPANRSDLYRHCKPHDTFGDQGISVEAGEELISHFLIDRFPCEDIPAFYARFFALRKTLLSNERPPCLYTRQLWDLMERHFNTENWSGEYYAEVSHVWQCGWVGGGMSSYPLLKYGSEISRLRAAQTLDYMTRHQAPSGFYYGKIENGRILDDSFGEPGLEGAHMIRKSADGLYFLFKHFTAAQPKPAWVESARRCADAFVKLYDTYGNFGQFVHVETGRMLIGGSSAGMLVPAALAKAWAYFGNREYLETAAASMEAYYQAFCRSGVTNGGPGEILGAPDSESAFAMLESCIVLYELLKEPKWLGYAQTAAQYCASWVVSYAYQFPANSEFGRLKINTVGSVVANVQNKHAAPGICTLSGDSLLKLYRFTGNGAYLELLKDIACFIAQCVSTENTPIYSWDDPPRMLKPGDICERVNMSDWEGADKVGGVFAGSCWCETSLMLSFAELMTAEEFYETI